MRIGIPAEVYPGETRVAATPETIKKLAAGARHTVAVQSGAGVAAAIPDGEFAAAGATIVPTAANLYSQSDIILKVRRPEPQEVPEVRPDDVGDHDRAVVAVRREDRPNRRNVGLDRRPDLDRSPLRHAQLPASAARAGRPNRAIVSSSRSWGRARAV